MGIIELITEGFKTIGAGISAWAQWFRRKYSPTPPERAQDMEASYEEIWGEINWSREMGDYDRAESLLRQLHDKFPSGVPKNDAGERSDSAAAGGDGNPGDQKTAGSGGGVRQ